MAASLSCTESSARQVEELTRQLHVLVCKYRWITESYVVEFFLKDHWSRLPPSWQTALASLTPPDIAESVLMNSPPTSQRSESSTVWPLSLLAFRAATLALALRRTAAQPAKLHPQSGRNPDLSHCYRAHVKPKKQHEIERLAAVINTMCEKAACCHIVDVGSGQGHLSRLLSFGYGHRVTSIEAVDCHVTGAAKFDQEVKAYFERKARASGVVKPEGIASPHHVVCTVHPYITVEEFLSVISARTRSNQDDRGPHAVSREDCQTGRQAYTNKRLKMDSAESGNVRSDKSSSSTDLSIVHGCTIPSSCQDCSATQGETSCHPTGKHSQSEAFLVTGLHTCGDLGPTMLRTFAECPPAVALASVACCYMRMSFCDKSCECHYSPVTLPSHSCGDAANLSSPNHPGSPNLDQSCSSEPPAKSSGSDKVSRPKGLSASELDVRLPMSKHVQSLCHKVGSTLSFEPLELACHFIEGYRARLKGECTNISCFSLQHNKTALATKDRTGNKRPRIANTFSVVTSVSDLKAELSHSTHFLNQTGHSGSFSSRSSSVSDPSLLTQGYRAALEVLIQEQCPDLNRSQEGARRIRKGVSSIKRAHQKSFEEYASSILGRLGLQSDPDRIHAVGETVLPRWHNLLTYHSLRQLMAPVVESLVLLDRALFLLDKGIESSLVPIFDPLLSPRNLVLLAIKKTR
ncbi:LOW QUALITY PROTEIN: protein RRNAD1-like [Acanthaster planci]|uniref:LOW QUALITY PROTEIN: protein RRNAD1-like n=1 Tax=Acanthaster planci TaxID=133434 RepID=A0A8B8A034_ACAPL|nr:LOW QUALITY PROTEIN: protein RRNAD1-like [Acanthaster planci]